MRLHYKCEPTFINMRNGVLLRQMAPHNFALCIHVCVGGGCVCGGLVTLGSFSSFLF